MCGAGIINKANHAAHQGSPPRVRSRRDGYGPRHANRGITSACAEQTSRRRFVRRRSRDHLRVCGADPRSPNARSRMSGSPPRVRSRPWRSGVGRGRTGITSACAEQTTSPEHVLNTSRDHLRVCGADHSSHETNPRMVGSPPRVRSRPRRATSSATSPGITSACAEQTPSASRDRLCLRDHLRVCGADGDRPGRSRRHEGSPPRVRSRHHVPLFFCSSAGITSACAEQTRHLQRQCCGREDHLRVCGADVTEQSGKAVGNGSPPRVRSRRRVRPACRAWCGITSACAEQTSRRWPRPWTNRDHLRVCGADQIIETAIRELPGSPPRVRSRLLALVSARDGDGITSACAEQTGRTSRTCRTPWDHLRVCGADRMEVQHRVAVHGSPPRVRSRQ